jgi:hypothetical protein
LLSPWRVSPRRRRARFLSSTRRAISFTSTVEGADLDVRFADVVIGEPAITFSSSRRIDNTSNRSTFSASIGAVATSAAI